LHPQAIYKISVRHSHYFCAALSALSSRATESAPNPIRNSRRFKIPACKRFSDIADAGPIDYLTQWRITKAQHLLENGNPSIEEVASAVGYSSHAAFSKAFKRVTSSSPNRAR
jgi:AraC-like DNA-binding protein